MFKERGYEAATFREIAQSAGLSTGAVFVTFTDKLELFDTVMSAEAKHQLEAMTTAGRDVAGTREQLVRVLAAGYEHQSKQGDLARWAKAVSWSHGLSGQNGAPPVRQGVIRLIQQILDDGETQGDTELLAEMIWNCFTQTYRYVVFDDRSLPWATARLEQQINLLLSCRDPRVVDDAA